MKGNLEKGTKMIVFWIFAIGVCLMGASILGMMVFMIIDVIYRLITKRNLRIDIRLATGWSMDEIRKIWNDEYLVEHGYL